MEETFLRALSLLVVLVLAVLPLALAYLARREEIERRVREELREEQLKDAERRRLQQQQGPSRPSIGFVRPRGDDDHQPRG